MALWMAAHYFRRGLAAQEDEDLARLGVQSLSELAKVF